MKRRIIPFSVVLFVTGLLCAVDRGAWAAAPMSIHIVKPTGSVTVPLNGKVTIAVKVTGMVLDPRAIGGRNVPGHGHYHFYVDCIPPQAYVTMVMSHCLASVAVSAPRTVFDLSKSLVKVGVGTHVLLAALAQNDHVLYSVPPAALLFTVTRPHMSVTIRSPMGPVTVPRTGQIQLSLQATGIKIAPHAIGRKNVPGEGHYHFYVDCIPPGAYVRVVFSNCLADASASSVFKLSKSSVKITPGPHLLLVALAQNDHVLYRAPAASLVFIVR